MVIIFKTRKSTARDSVSVRAPRYFYITVPRRPAIIVQNQRGSLRRNIRRKRVHIAQSIERTREGLVHVFGDVQTRQFPFAFAAFILPAPSTSSRRMSVHGVDLSAPNCYMSFDSIRSDFTGGRTPCRVQHSISHHFTLSHQQGRLCVYVRVRYNVIESRSRGTTSHSSLTFTWVFFPFRCVFGWPFILGDNGRKKGDE